jgi:hypothetical protein
LAVHLLRRPGVVLGVEWVPLVARAMAAGAGGGALGAESAGACVAAAATLAAADSATIAAAAAAAAMAGDTMGTLASRCTSRGRRCWCTASSASRDAPGHPQSQVGLTLWPSLDGF